MLSNELKQELLDFRTKRDWEQFHTLRTLSTSLVLESAELLELTRWTRDSELEHVVGSRRSQIEHEVADIAILLTYLAHDLRIDLEAAVRAKFVLNGEKYPVELASVVSRKYLELNAKPIVFHCSAIGDCKNGKEGTPDHEA